MPRAAISLLFVIACSSKTEAPRPAPVHLPDDAGAGTFEPREPAPTAGVRADPRGDEPPGRPSGRPQTHAARPIEIVLRSSPAGAIAAVDGAPIGPTPSYWAGEADGREHEFTFVLPGHASARYRFVPITSGVVHARLELLAEDNDAGVPPEPIRGPGDPAAPGPTRVSPAPPDPAPGATDTAHTGSGR